MSYKILLAHNYYQQSGGEDIAFAAEGKLLREKGHGAGHARSWRAFRDHLGSRCSPRVISTELKPSRWERPLLAACLDILTRRFQVFSQRRNRMLSIFIIHSRSSRQRHIMPVMIIISQLFNPCITFAYYARPQRCIETDTFAKIV